MQAYFWVGLGGLIGSLARYAVTLYCSDLSAERGFPFGTLAANLIGCSLIGAAGALFSETPVAAQLRLFVVVGLLGGFTTFSSFSVETLLLLQHGRPGAALAYVLSSLGGGVLCSALLWRSVTFLRTL